jgi:hypothetical protein
MRLSDVYLWEAISVRQTTKSFIDFCMLKFHACELIDNEPAA